MGRGTALGWGSPNVPPDQRDLPHGDWLETQSPEAHPRRRRGGAQLACVKPVLRTQLHAQV